MPISWLSKGVPISETMRADSIEKHEGAIGRREQSVEVEDDARASVAMAHDRVFARSIAAPVPRESSSRDSRDANATPW